jgi:hypothetical protein
MLQQVLGGHGDCTLVLWLPVPPILPVEIGTCRVNDVPWLQVQQWGFEVSTSMVVEVNNSLVNEDGKGMLPPKPLQLRHTQAIKHSRVDDAVGKV